LIACSRCRAGAKVQRWYRGDAEQVQRCNCRGAMLMSKCRGSVEVQRWCRGSAEVQQRFRDGAEMQVQVQRCGGGAK